MCLTFQYNALYFPQHVWVLIVSARDHKDHRLDSNLHQAPITWVKLKGVTNTLKWVEIDSSSWLDPTGIISNFSADLRNGFHYKSVWADLRIISYYVRYISRTRIYYADINVEWKWFSEWMFIVQHNIWSIFFGIFYLERITPASEILEHWLQNVHGLKSPWSLRFKMFVFLLICSKLKYVTRILDLRSCING